MRYEGCPIADPGNLQSESQPTRHPARFGGRTIVGIILLALTILLLTLAIVLPWWTLSSSNGQSSLLYLDRACSPNPSGTVCDKNVGALGDAFAVTTDLLVAGLAASVACLALLVLSSFRPRLGVGTLVSGIAGAVLVLSAPLYLYTALPAALASIGGPQFVTGFFGSFSPPGNPIVVTWGGGSAWFLTLGATVTLVVGALIAFSASRRLRVRGSPKT